MSGQTGAIVPASTVPKRVINWRSDVARPVTVTLVAVNDPNGAAPILFNSLDPFRANLTWGTAAGVSSAVIDYPMRGSTFTVTASSLTLDVYPDGVATFGPGVVENPDVKIGAFMAPGASRPNATPPTYSYAFENLNGGIVGVPQHARAYYIEDNVDWAFAPAADQLAWRVQCQNRGTPGPQPGVLTQVLRWDMAWISTTAGHVRTPPFAGSPLPLPARTTHLEVMRQPGYGPPSSRTAVVFLLDLGA